MTRLLGVNFQHGQFLTCRGSHYLMTRVSFQRWKLTRPFPLNIDPGGPLGTCSSLNTGVIKFKSAGYFVMKMVLFVCVCFWSVLSYTNLFVILLMPPVQCNWAPSSEFVSSSIPSCQILTAHAQPFRGARDLAFCLKVPLDSQLVWASSGGSGETARMRRLAWTFAAPIGDKYQIRLTRSN